MKRYKLSILTTLLLAINQLLIAQDTLLIQQVVNLALENNFGILISKNEANIAVNNNTLGNAGLLPQITADGSKTINQFKTHQVYSTGVVKDADAAKTDALAARLMLNWTIFDGFSMFASKQKLTELENIGKIQSQQEIQTTVYQSVALYYNIVQQQKALHALEKTLEISNERLKLAHTKAQIGTASDLTLLQAELDRNADSSEYIQQQILLESSKIELNKMLARDANTLFNVSSEIPINISLQHDSLLVNINQKNPQLISAQFNTQIAKLNLKLARSSYYPKISVFAGYSISNTTSQAGFYEINRGQGPTYGITATFNIFNGFNASRNTKNAKIQQMNAEYYQKQTEQEITSQFDKLFNEYTAQLLLVKLEAENATSAHRSTEISYQLYKQGMLSDIDFRAAQQKQIDADLRMLSAQYLAKLKEAQLLLLSGEMGF